jgi:hypothetical protein
MCVCVCVCVSLAPERFDESLFITGRYPVDTNIVALRIKSLHRNCYASHGPQTQNCYFLEHGSKDFDYILITYIEYLLK